MLARQDATIKVDWDDSTEPDLGVMFAKLQRAGYMAVDVTLRPSPSGNGWHVLIDVEPCLTHPMEVVALQAILGSDPWREAMQMNRARAYRKAPAWMRKDWNVLYLSDSRRSRNLKLKGA